MANKYACSLIEIGFTKCLLEESPPLITIPSPL